MAALYNLNTRSSETDPVQDWQDFFTEWKEDQPEEPEQTEEEMFQIMSGFAKSRTEGLDS